MEVANVASNQGTRVMASDWTEICGSVKALILLWIPQRRPISEVVAGGRAQPKLRLTTPALRTEANTITMVTLKPAQGESVSKAD